MKSKQISTSFGCIVLLMSLSTMATLFIFAFYPFVIIDFPDEPQIEILNEGKRVPVGGVLKFRMATRKYWDITDQIVKSLVASNADSENEPQILRSVTSFTDLPIGDHTRDSSFQILVTEDNPGKNRRLIVTYHYNMIGRDIIRTSVSEPFEIYVPDYFPVAFFVIHERTHYFIDCLKKYDKGKCDELVKKFREEQEQKYGIVK